MEYPKRSVNGDAGEYLVAYTVTRKLSWPCRLYGVDLGVDAELEVLDGSGQSTGDIIKIQVKAVERIPSADQASIYVDDRHIEYWKRFCLPVIVCCVELSTEKIYWKQITATEAFKSGGESRKVSFCLEHDKLNETSAELLRALVHPAESKQIEPLFSQLREAFARLPSESTQYYDIDSIVEAEELCEAVRQAIDKLAPLIAYFPWRLSSVAHAEYMHIKNSVRHLKGNLGRMASEIMNGG